MSSLLLKEVSDSSAFPLISGVNLIIVTANMVQNQISLWAGAGELALSFHAFVFQLCYCVIPPGSLNVLGFN